VLTYDSLELEGGSPRFRLGSIHANDLKFIWSFQQTALPARPVFQTRGYIGDTVYCVACHFMRPLPSFLQPLHEFLVDNRGRRRRQRTLGLRADALKLV
jgi:hypothetical protein